MTHGGAATLCRPVLLYNLVMATKECECGMMVTSAIREHRRHQKPHSLLQAKKNKGEEEAVYEPRLR